MENINVIIEIALGLLSSFILLMLKWLREDIKTAKKDLKIDIDNLSKKQDLNFSKLDKDITDMKVQLGKLETRVEERTLRVIHVDKSNVDKTAQGI